MIELNEHNVVEYLRRSGRVSNAEIFVQSLSGGVANAVFKIFDAGGGERVGSDLRTADEAARQHQDLRPMSGACFVVKQPLARFKTAEEWLVDIGRVEVERDCIRLLQELLPAGSLPQVMWFDPENSVLAISCAPPDSMIWKTALLAGEISLDAAVHAGMLLAMLHSSTKGNPAIETRFGDPRFFVQQRTDPYLRAAGAKNPAQTQVLSELSKMLLDARHCLIHGDFSPKNIFLVPHQGDVAKEIQLQRAAPGAFALSHLMLLDFEVAFYGHCGFDVATLLNHLVLKAFHRANQWRAFMMMADTFWETYRNSVDPSLGRTAGSLGGHILGALLLARVDGKSPVEYLVGNDTVQQRIRDGAKAILSAPDRSLEFALDLIGEQFRQAAEHPSIHPARMPS